MKKVVCLLLCFIFAFGGGNVFALSANGQAKSKSKKEIHEKINKKLEEKRKNEKVLFEITSDDLIKKAKNTNKNIKGIDTIQLDKTLSAMNFASTSSIGSIFPNIEDSIFTTKTDDKGVYVSNCFVYGDDYRTNSVYAMFYDREYIYDEYDPDIDHVATDFLIVKISSMYSHDTSIDTHNEGYDMAVNFEVLKSARYVYSVKDQRIDDQYTINYPNGSNMRFYDVGASYTDLTSSKVFLYRADTNCYGIEQSGSSFKGAIFAGLAYYYRSSPWLFAIEELIGKSTDSEIGDSYNILKTYENSYDSQVEIYGKAIKTHLVGFPGLSIKKANHNIESRATFKINKNETYKPNFTIRYSFKIGYGWSSDDYYPQ